MIVQKQQRSCKTQKEKLFDTLSDLKWHTTGELQHVAGHRFSSLIRELRKQGYKIITLSSEHRQWKYKLISLVPGEPIEPKIRLEYDRSVLEDFAQKLSDIQYTLDQLQEEIEGALAE